MKLSLRKTINDDRVDFIGVVASGLCAVHCLFCALLPTIFGVLGLGFLLTHEAEWALTLLAVTFALSAGFIGWRLHRSSLVFGLLSLGIIGLLASRGIEMSSEHHDHHGDEHQVDGVHHAESAHHGEEHTEHEHHNSKNSHSAHVSTERNEHENNNSSEEDSTHSIGAVVGFLGGMLLFLGHIINIRTSGEVRKECCNNAKIV